MKVVRQRCLFCCAGFLRYHTEAVSWDHRSGVMLDLMLVWGYWPVLQSVDDCLLQYRRAGRIDHYGLVIKQTGVVPREN
ncbi:MAG: hypothetical protein ACE5LB_16850 [Acidiferrobacterales bacterium]